MTIASEGKHGSLEEDVLASGGNGGDGGGDGGGIRRTLGEAAALGGEAQWGEAWQRRLECWFMTLPGPTQTQLGSCVGALGLHLASRLDAAWRASQSRLGLPSETGGARAAAGVAEPGCTWVNEAASLPQLPPFPELRLRGGQDTRFMLLPLHLLLPLLIPERDLFKNLLRRVAQQRDPDRRHAGSAILGRRTPGAALGRAPAHDVISEDVLARTSLPSDVRTLRGVHPATGAAARSDGPSLLQTAEEEHSWAPVAVGAGVASFALALTLTALCARGVRWARGGRPALRRSPQRGEMLMLSGARGATMGSKSAIREEIGRWSGGKASGWGHNLSPPVAGMQLLYASDGGESQSWRG